MSEKITSQSEKGGQRLLTFLLVVLVMNLTLWVSTVIKSPPELTIVVIYMEAFVGTVLILGRTGVHVAEAWARSKGFGMTTTEVHRVTVGPPKEQP